MARRYVPKTYNNKRLLRVILGAIVSTAIAAVVIFILLFFALENYWVDGRLEIPWLMEEPVQTE